MLLYILLGLLVLIVIYFIAAYNQLVSARVHVAEGWSGIDVQIKRRADLIPNLLNIVKGYMAHETTLLTSLTELRTKSLSVQSPKEQSVVDGMLSSALKSVIAVAENYPDLKASKNFKALQEQLAAVEDDLQLARRYYNGTVRENNIRVQSFPSSIVASLFSFRVAEFFEVSEGMRNEVPVIKF